ncbi:MAG: hypothetical protein HC842_01220 [Cytophagales bacterium]|nr:hypothetical protein [Cytophagales bacterium]
MGGTTSGIVSKISGAPDRKYIKKVRRVLASTSFEYRPVSGVAAKVERLVPYQSRLLAITPVGIYEVVDTVANLVVDEPVSQAIALSTEQEIILADYNHHIRLYKQFGEVWAQVGEVDDFYDAVSTMYYQERKDLLWVAGLSHLYCYRVVNNESFELVKTYPLSNEHFDTPIIHDVEGEIYLVTKDGYYLVGPDAINPDLGKEKELGKPLKKLVDNQGVVWIYNGVLWSSWDGQGKYFHYEYLGLFPHMNLIYRKPASSAYLIKTSQNRLFTFQSAQEYQQIASNQLHIKRVVLSNGALPARDKLVFGYDEGRLSFELTQPDFLGLNPIEFQYRMEGYMDQWSEWSSENKVDFNLLQPGEYAVSIRSRDAFGRIQESDRITFIIRPPYWQQPWFYALEVIFLGGLILISAQLNRRNTRYKLLTSGLTVLTLVLIIELIQSTVQNYLSFSTSPVIDFMLNIGVALLILPVERGLNSFITSREEKGNVVRQARAAYFKVVRSRTKK